MVAHYSEHDVSGTVSVRGITAHVHTSDDRQVGIGAFPIAIDPTPFLVDVEKAEVRSERGESPTKSFLGVGSAGLHQGYFAAAASVGGAAQGGYDAAPNGVFADCDALPGAD